MNLGQIQFSCRYSTEVESVWVYGAGYNDTGPKVSLTIVGISLMNFKHIQVDSYMLNHLLQINFNHHVNTI